MTQTEKIIFNPPVQYSEALTPYKGLMPYTMEDAPFFFGRETEREIISANLTAYKLTLLYGPSGVGKSSVLRAGVAHDLQQLAQQNLVERGTPEHFGVVFSAWRDDPLMGLVNAIRVTIAQTLGRAEPDPAPDTRSLVDLFKFWTELHQSDLFIILDQFEEYFLYHPYEEGLGTFAFEFPAAVNHPYLRAHFLISIRDDALAQLDRFKGRIHNLFDNYYRIRHLTREGARAAIEKPLAEYNRLLPAETKPFTIEPALVEAVLEQVQTGQVVLGEAGRGVVGVRGNHIAETRIETPFLQMVMNRIWEMERRADSHILRLATLRTLGGAERIVRTHLDNVMSTLTASEEEAAIRIFNYLVTPSGAKIAHTAIDLAELAKLPVTQLLPLINKLSGSGLRIVRPVAPPPEHPETPRYEIFHDVLAPAILDWRARRVMAQERAEVERQVEEQRLRAEEKTRAAARLRRFTLALAVVSVAAIFMALWAWQQRRQALIHQREAQAAQQLAEQQARLADSLRVAELAARDTAETQRQRAEQAQTQATVLRARELAAAANNNLESDPELSVLLAMHAVSLTYAADRTVTSEAHDALDRAVQTSRIRLSLSGHTNVVRGVAFSPDGKRLASVSLDGTARMWDARSGRKLLTFSGPVVALYGLAFSPDGSRLATAGVDGAARIFDAVSGQMLLTLSGHSLAVNSLAYNPDGTRLITASSDGNIKVWNAASGQELSTIAAHTAAINSVACSPDGKRLATGSADGITKIWEASSRQLLRVLADHNGPINSVAFSPDGKYVATAGNDWKVKLWEAQSGKEVLTFSGHNTPVNAVAFSADGKLLAAVDNQGKIKIWALASGREMLALPSHRAAVLSVAFSADGRQLATAGADRKIKIWDISPGEEVLVISGHPAAVKSVAFSADGTRLATAGDDMTAKVWNAVSGAELLTLSGHTEAINRVVFDAEGKYLATASDDNTARVWEATTGALIARMTHMGDVKSVAFSPDGKLLATASFDQTACLWEVASGKKLLTLSGHKHWVTDVAFCPDGMRLATASMDGAAKMWEVASGKELFAIANPNGKALPGIAFSPDGARIAAVSAIGAIKIWSATSGKELRAIAAHDVALNAIAFSPNGTRLATAGADGIVQVWDAVSGQKLLTLTSHSGAVNGLAFSPDGRRLATAGNDKTVRVHALIIEDLLTLARTRVLRNLTREECRKYLSLENCPPLPF